MTSNKFEKEKNMTAEEHILIQREQGILKITINRASKKNALTQNMYQTLATELIADDGCRIVVITGKDGAFTSGNDLKDFMTKPPSGDHRNPAPVEMFMQSLMATKKIVIAGVNGLAIGVGVTMLMHCDLVYAAKSATFKTPFVDLAVAPEFGSSQLFPLQMGHVKAADLLLLGSKWNADKACQHALVTEVVDDADLDAKLQHVVEALSEKPPEALLEAKRLMRRELEPLSERVDYETKQFIKLLKSPEFMEAATAFMQKRKANFNKTK